MTVNQTIEGIVHSTFVKYDIIGVIEKGFPNDEYQMEESKLQVFIENEDNITKDNIYIELIKIIEDWFGESPLHRTTLSVLDEMSQEIFLSLRTIEKGMV